MRLLAFTCGWLTAPVGAFRAGAKGELRVPVPSFLVEHPRGLVLFDTGMHPEVQVDPHARLGWKADVFRADYHAGEDVAARLAALDVDVRAVGHVVVSHLHFDHAGGLACVPDARLVVQRREWDAGRDADLTQANGYDPRDYDL